MGQGIAGNYDGEGPNVAPKVIGVLNNPGPTRASPAIPDKRGTLNNGIVGGQGIGGDVPIDIRGRLRTSSEPARQALAINVGGGDQILSVCSRALYVSTTGNLTVRFADDLTTDVALVGLTAGVVYPFAIAIVRASGASATGVLLF